MPALRERPQHPVQLLARVAVEHVPGVERRICRTDRFADVRAHDALRDQLPVGPAACKLASELAVRYEPPLGIEREDPSGTEPTATHRHALRQRHRTRLRGDGDELVARDSHAQRSQPVAVERGATRATVGEAERGGAVPRLAEHRAVAVKVADVVVQPGVVLPGGRHEDGDRLREVAPVTADEQLERVVE